MELFITFVETFTEAAVEVTSVEASTTKFRGSYSDGSFHASMPWKFPWKVPRFHASFDRFHGSFHGSFHELPSKMQMVRVARTASQLPDNNRLPPYRCTKDSTSPPRAILEVFFHDNGENEQCRASNRLFTDRSRRNVTKARFSFCVLPLRWRVSATNVVLRVGVLCSVAHGIHHNTFTS